MDRQPIGSAGLLGGRVPAVGTSRGGKAVPASCADRYPALRKLATGWAVALRRPSGGLEAPIGVLGEQPRFVDRDASSKAGYPQLQPTTTAPGGTGMSLTYWIGVVEISW